ncbi:DUF4080 domain-containing protein [Utexia brackfieldae]|uniref:B12-binding domain-containing radical SAM protein n=1 Tax=Utexia brackfieldae TaxID=3074108 RepID=UPI00370D0AA8
MNIILTTINARYAHTSLGLRYLYANLQEHQAYTTICEYTLEQRPIDIVEQLLAQKPTVIGLGVYIWNIQQSTEVVSLLKAIRPDLIIILGGPEVSHEQHLNPIVQTADYVITGWGEASLPTLLSAIKQGQIPTEKIINGIRLPLSDIAFPYDYYTDTDLKQRILYVEASRGCPFKCEFCLSSIDDGAKMFNIADFMLELEKLYQRGARAFKFVDRTFNLKIEHSKKILVFFLNKLKLFPEEPIFAHFEVIPDFLPDELKTLIKQFPPGALQLEIGIQTLNTEVQKNISRRTHLGRAKQNIMWLSTQTGAHLHVDLIAALPGEDLTSFAKGFNELWTWHPQEIQLGILKRLKGTPIGRHIAEYQYVYDNNPPFSVLQNRDISFSDMQKLTRLTRFWDLIVNSGRFPHAVPLLLRDKPFENMWAFSEWLFGTIKQTHQIALTKLTEYLFNWLMQQPISAIDVLQAVSADFGQMGIQGWPHYLGPAPADWRVKINQTKHSQGITRQKRHITE